MFFLLIFRFDRTLGGFEMELRLRDHLAKLFNEQKKSKKDVRENLRAMAKLLKEAQRLKTVLSANAEFMAQVSQTEMTIYFNSVQYSLQKLRKSIKFQLFSKCILSLLLLWAIQPCMFLSFFFSNLLLLNDKISYSCHENSHRSWNGVKRKQTNINDNIIT